MARHERQPNKADSQASNVRKPRTFSSTATVGTSKSNNSVNATNRDEKLRTKAPGTSTERLPKIHSKSPYRKACKMATLGYITMSRT